MNQDLLFTSPAERANFERSPLRHRRSLVNHPGGFRATPPDGSDRTWLEVTQEQGAAGEACGHQLGEGECLAAVLGARSQLGRGS
jgi:hypothetical protein